ncbi:hypothetical protein CORC01_04970 [Colletotrichum orchidophilum]|uniref:Uncharacterized protein n=1 Tax=Colletotrichum orchidophilum TaxID=1209926 RepID=A0A1G4BEG7_9PEZI|nr:uncharacterized protein CORC01_04970 [Colletotrichum orchidophilum]OHE99834.1 hypothetical protein CORC01_04970 [Colletotrichum orchidophilum]
MSEHTNSSKQGLKEEAKESLTATFKLDVRNPFARPPLHAISTVPKLAAAPDQELCGACGRASLAAFPWVPQSQPPRDHWGRLVWAELTLDGSAPSNSD